MKYLLIFLLVLCSCIEKLESDDDMGNALNMHAAGKTGGWSASGVLRTGNDTDEVTLQCNFPRSEDYTVEFNLKTEPDTPDPGVPIRAEALITWSVEGNSVTRRVDVGNGVSVTGVGAACRVRIIDVTDRSLLPPIFTIGLRYTVSVQVAPGTRGNTQQPPTLSPFPKGSNATIIVPPAGTANIPIPNDAGIVAVSTTAYPNSPLVFVQHIQAATILKIYNPTDAIWVPIAPGATTIQVVNGSAVGVAFQITFGIDG